MLGRLELFLLFFADTSFWIEVQRSQLTRNLFQKVHHQLVNLLKSWLHLKFSFLVSGKSSDGSTHAAAISRRPGVAIFKARNGVSQHIVLTTIHGRSGKAIATLVFHQGRHGCRRSIGTENTRIFGILGNNFSQLCLEVTGTAVFNLATLLPAFPIGFPTSIVRILGLGGFWKRSSGSSNGQYSKQCLSTVDRRVAFLLRRRGR